MLGSFSPTAEKRRTKAAIEETQKAAEKERGIAAAKTEADYQALQKHALEGIAAPTGESEKKVEMESYEDFVKAAHERYLKNPTNETYEDWREAASGFDEAKLYEEKARKTLVKEQERKAKTRSVIELITKDIPLSAESTKYVEERMKKGGNHV